MNKYLWLLISVLLVQIAYSQSPTTCVTDEYNAPLIKANPLKYQKIEEDIQNYLNNKMTDEQLPVTVEIPIVVHVVWNDSVENLHDSIIHQQIEVLNRDFTLSNTDTSILTDTLKLLPGNFGITFNLIAINRKYTQNPAFSYTDNAVKFDSLGGIDAWDTENYMNIWVCDLWAGLLGYSQFPGGPGETDGNVIDFAVVGNQMYPWSYGPHWSGGRVLVHEIGHWLNLYHPWWGTNLSWCGDDEVYDTGLQDGPNYPSGGCPDTIFSNCVPSEREIVKTYMDYCGDSCMVMFTQGQVERGHASLFTHRPTLINSNPTIIEETKPETNIKLYPTVSNFTVTVELPEALENSFIKIHTLSGKLVQEENISNQNKHILDISKLSNGLYFLGIYHNGKRIEVKHLIVGPSKLIIQNLKKEDDK